MPIGAADPVVAFEKPLRKKLTNKIGMEFLLIPGGEFVMGKDDIAPDPHDLAAVEAAIEKLSREPNFGWYDFAPKHAVTVKPFYLAKHPVTQGQWTRVMGLNKSSYKGAWDLPVETVTWHEANAFARKLNEMMDTDGHRLPTEAEWEFACRAGSTGPYCFEGRIDRLDHYAWHGKNAGFRTKTVAQLRPNKFGLFDMHGLVWEWTSSQAKPLPYRADDGREEADSPLPRVVKGGSWNTDAYFCQSGVRDWHLPVHRDHDIGFRLAVS